MPANSTDDRRTCESPAPPAVQPLPAGVHAGASVLLRGRRCHLSATVTHADCRELHVTGAADGRTRVLLWPFDRPVVIAPRPRVRAVRLRTWRDALLRGVAGTIDPLTPRSRGAAAVDLVPFQLAPAVAMAAGTSRILLADEVGLGKTIQAGWIVADLMTRRPAARVLLAVPAGLRSQWKEELSARFDIDASAVDAAWLRRTVADLPADVSPWAPPGVYIASLDFLKRPDVASSIALQVWDLLVVDEAHTAAAPTDRHAALSCFAAMARRVIAITATPYSGQPASFASLTALGAIRDSGAPLMFRRSRADVGDPRRRRHRFARVRITRAESQLQRLLERYSRDVWNESTGEADGARLAVTILRKRALSSPAAAARSLRRRLDLLQGRAQAPRQLPLFDDDDSVEDDVASGALAAPGLADAAREHRWLAASIAAAGAACEADSKLRYLQRLIHRFGRESIVIFTEYRDTLLQLAAALPPSLQLHGGLPAAERTLVQQRFNQNGGLLLATDAAAEGLNLHHRCRLVVNYELPWNPARLEQRIGRVDRIGQQRTVHALTLTARDTAEDLVIRNLARRLTRIAATLGPGDRLGAFLDDARTAGIVIGGEAIDGAIDAPADAALVIRHDGDLGAAARAAAQLARGRAGREQETTANDILVSGMRARPAALDPGYVVVIICTARTADGFVAAAQTVLLHVPAGARKPVTAAAARSIAERLRGAIDWRAAVPAVDRWFAGVRQTHEASVDDRTARERALMNRRRDRGLVQPGLFDRRALSAAERLTAAEESVLEDHRRHIDALARSRALELTCAPSAVLIVWR